METEPTTIKNGERKSSITKRTRLSPKERAFAREYAKRLNGTQAALSVYDTKDPNVAGAIASENLLKPKIKTEIESLLRDNEITKEEILSIHKRNMLQDKHLPTSQKAVESFESMLGLAGDKNEHTTQIAFILQK